MFVKKLENCGEITASDGCRLRELLHPRIDPVTLPYSVAVARVEKNGRTYKHRLEQTEVYYILSGTGRMHVDDELQNVAAGDVILVPPGTAQWLENTGDCDVCFMVIVSPPWTEEADVRLD